jgi:pyruvate dehydrogenase (quinone)
MKTCDTVMILGSTMPWEEYYPRPGQAHGVQVDLKADRLGLRYPVEVGVTGDVKATLPGLLPMLQRKTDRSFLKKRSSGWSLGIPCWRRSRILLSRRSGRRWLFGR